MNVAYLHDLMIFSVLVDWRHVEAARWSLVDWLAADGFWADSLRLVPSNRALRILVHDLLRTALVLNVLSLLHLLHVS